MFSNATFLSLTAFILLVLWRIYWAISEKKANTEKPKIKEKLAGRRLLSKIFVLAAFGVVGVQLLGVPFYDLPLKSEALHLIGFLLVLIGWGTAIIGRHTLGTNWSNCYDYQVKRKQGLVTTGIYSYIRHPLYAGIALFFIGSELIVQSYLVFFYCFGFLAAYYQARLEEKLLISHFGEKYKKYMKQTKMFLPFVW